MGRKELKLQHQIEDQNGNREAGRLPQDDIANPSVPSYIRVPEIAQRLGVGRLTVYAMLEAGVIPGIPFGRRWIVTRYAFLQWERSCGVKTPHAGVE